MISEYYQQIGNGLLSIGVGTVLSVAAGCALVLGLDYAVSRSKVSKGRNNTGVRSMTSAEERLVGQRYTEVVREDGFNLSGMVPRGSSNLEITSGGGG